MPKLMRSFPWKSAYLQIWDTYSVKKTDLFVFAKWSCIRRWSRERLPDASVWRWFLQRFQAGHFDCAESPLPVWPWSGSQEDWHFWCVQNCPAPLSLNLNSFSTKNQVQKGNDNERWCCHTLFATALEKGDGRKGCSTSKPPKPPTKKLQCTQKVHVCLLPSFLV